MDNNSKILINDVLINHQSQKLKFAHNHVGNRRFEVMLQICRDRFLNALNKGKERDCLKIIVDIVDTICHKVVPNGRFLEYCDKFDIW